MSILSLVATIMTGAGVAAGQPNIKIPDSTAVYTRSEIESVDRYRYTDEADYDYDDVLQLETLPIGYDSLLTAWHERSKQQAFDTFFNDFIDIDTTEFRSSNIPDSVYQARLKMILSPIQMPYNHIVKSHIIAYTTSKKSLMSRVIARSQYYFPMIEAELDRAGLPLELRMLPVIESTLTPTAVSPAGASGLWQFMYSTGRHYGLEVNSFVDQRRDPVAATRAACNFLKDLYDMFGDWTLAIAAYNCGPNNVSKAIKKAGGEKNFWKIYPYLPLETRNYIPSFIAANYAYTFHRQHDIEPDEVQLPLATDTIMVDNLMHFKQISSTIDTPIEMIRKLNPQYKADIIPAVGKSYALTLPVSDALKFAENEKKIMAKDVAYLADYLKPGNIDTKSGKINLKPANTDSKLAKADKKRKKQSHASYTVKSGDTLSTIASKNGVKVKQIVQWNKLKDADRLKIGQKLAIYR